MASVLPEGTFKEAHNPSDVDAEPSAQHHTLGTGPTQAAPGSVVSELLKDHNELEIRFDILGGFTLPPCRVATTADVPVMSGLLVIDGVQLEAEDRILVKVQIAQIQNGIWIAKLGAWVRAEDANTEDAVKQGTRVFVTGEGAVQAVNKTFTQLLPINNYNADPQQWRPLLQVDVGNSLSFPTPLSWGHQFFWVNNKALVTWNGSTWVIGNGVVLCTAATRPPQPLPTSIIYEVDTGKSYIWDGSAWQPLSSSAAPTRPDVAQTNLTTVNVTSGNLYYTVRSGIVFVEGNIGFASLASGAGLTLVNGANFPSTLRPPASIYVPGRSNAGSFSAQIGRFNDGGITLVNTSGGAITSAQFNYSYPAP